MAKVSRSYVYAVLDGERAYQKAGKGNAAPHPDSKRADGALSPGEALLCMEQLLVEARANWYKGVVGQDLMLPFIRKATAVGVQVMENYGASAREGYEPDPSSYADAEG